MWACGHQTDVDDLFSQLSEKLRMQLLMAKKRRLLLLVEIFQHLTVHCTLQLIDCLDPVIVLPREYVCVQGQRGAEMFFISRGILQVTVVMHGEEFPLQQLRDGGAFG